MKKSRYTEEQIAFALKQAETGESVYRLYRNGGLSLHLKKPRRNVSATNRERQHTALATKEMWSMDFVSDALVDG